MAKDDIFVIMYKILAYLYSCLKNGDTPIYKYYAYDGEVLDIPEPYWCEIMQQLQDYGYIKGLTITNTFSGRVIIKGTPCITIEGVQYLNENSMMKKALNVLKEAKSSLPFI